VNSAYVSALANHLWQSTWFAAIAGLLTLRLRNNRARVRYWVWLAASWKFLIPFSVLISLGGQVHWRTVPQAAEAGLSVVMGEVSQPFTAAAASPAPASTVPALLCTIWACGLLGISGSWWVRWRRIRAVVRAGKRVQLELPIRAVSSPTLLEPGVFGVFRPVLLLPEGLLDRLTAAQTRGVIAHEMCHVDHRDNLMAAIHMFVETVFWFHPLVWWIGKRMVEERERACDEEVLRLGSEPRAYAEGILEICKLYVESPLACVSGMAGANLRKRVVAIMRDHGGVRLSRAKKVLLAAAGALALAAPIGVGIVNAPVIRAQSASAKEGKSFEVASVKRLVEPSVSVSTGGGPGTPDPGRWWRSNVTLASLLVEAFHVQGHAIVGPDWLRSSSQPRYEVMAKIPAGASRDDVLLMLQKLLTERFGLTFHREQKEMPAYALVTGRNGPKLTPATDSPARVAGRGGFPDLPAGVAPGVIQVDGVGHLHRLAAGAMSMGQFADYLAGQSDLPVVDLTDLRGKYDIVLYYSRNAQAIPADDGPELPTALREQLGLELQTRKARVDILVIDHIEQEPSAN
jgi:uncharacterized protein (TIGR03435 family)